MLRKLLTEEQREELDDECRRYALWRRQTKLGPDDFIHDMLNSRTNLTQYDQQQQQQSKQHQQQRPKQRRQKRNGHGSGVNSSFNNVNSTSNQVVNSSPENVGETLTRHIQEQPETIAVEIDAIGSRDRENDVETNTVINGIGVEPNTTANDGTGVETNTTTNNGVVDPASLAGMNVNCNARRGVRSQRSKKDSDSAYGDDGDSEDDSRGLDYLFLRSPINSLARVTFREEESFELGEKSEEGLRKLEFGSQTIDSEAAAAAANEKLAEWKQNRIIPVDEILAKGLRDWREQRSNFRSSPFGQRRRESTWARKFSAFKVNEKRHPVRRKIQQELEDRKWKLEMDKAAFEEYISAESYTESSTDAFSATETEAASVMEDDQIHRKIFRRNLLIAADVIKLIAYFSIFFAILSRAYQSIPQPGPKDYVQYNLTVKTDCYFYGDKGLLNDNNPCTYRGIIGHDWLERECLEWKDAIDSGKYLPGVGIDGIVYEHYRDHAQIGRDSADTKYRDFRRLKEGLRKFRKNYYDRKTKNLSENLQKAADDYERRFCRRFAPMANYPVCLTLGDKGREDGKEIYLTSCDIPPCPVMIEKECYEDMAAYNKKNNN